MKTPDVYVIALIREAIYDPKQLPSAIAAIMTHKGVNQNEAERLILPEIEEWKTFMKANGNLDRTDPCGEGETEPTERITDYYPLLCECHSPQHFDLFFSQGEKAQADDYPYLKVSLRKDTLREHPIDFYLANLALAIQKDPAYEKRFREILSRLFDVPDEKVDDIVKERMPKYLLSYDTIRNPEPTLD